MSIIYEFFGTILKFFYDLCNNYGVALILFTLAVKVLLLPLGIKQQKNTIKQIKLQPKERLIRKKFAYDKNLAQQKVMEFYQTEGFNPMGGCLPLLIQLPILFILYRVIQQPLTYISGYSAEAITAISTKLQSLSLTEAELALMEKFTVNPQYGEISLMQVMSSHIAELGELFKGVPDFNFLGIDLTLTPSLSNFNLLLLIPLFSFLTSVLQTLVSQSTTKYTSQNQQKNNSLMMFIMGPGISLVFTFMFNAGIGLYWIISNVFGVLQTLLLNAFMSPAQAAADAEYELKQAVLERKLKKARLAKERQERIEQEKLDKKNAARKAAGQKPLTSLEEKSTEEENGEDEND